MNHRFKLPCGRIIEEKKLFRSSLGDVRADREKVKHSMLQQLNGFIVANELNRSTTRNLMLEIIFEHFGPLQNSRNTKHFTALDALDFLKLKNKKFSKASFYRALPIFIGAGVLKLGPRNLEGQIQYEFSNASHKARAGLEAPPQSAHHGHLESAREPQFVRHSSPHHHDHMICGDCSHVFEFHNEKIEREQSRVAKKMGFQIESHQHSLMVRCELLAKKHRKS